MSPAERQAFAIGRAAQTCAVTAIVVTFCPLWVVVLFAAVLWAFGCMAVSGFEE